MSNELIIQEPKALTAALRKLCQEHYVSAPEGEAAE